jgi:hypothetical protein
VHHRGVRCGRGDALLTGTVVAVASQHDVVVGEHTRVALELRTDVEPVWSGEWDTHALATLTTLTVSALTVFGTFGAVLRRGVAQSCPAVLK